MNFKDKAMKQWKSNYTWQPLLTAIAIVFIIAIRHKVHWEMTTETDPLSIWNERLTTEQNNETRIYYDNNYLNETVTFKGVLETVSYTHLTLPTICSV